MLRGRQGHGLTSVFQPRLCRSPPLLLSSHVHSRRYSDAHLPPSYYDVAVLGGGVTGLSSAYYLARQLPKARITVYEASARVGGWLASKRVPVDDGSIIFEAGPRTLRPAGNGILTGSLVRRRSSHSLSLCTWLIER